MFTLCAILVSLVGVLFVEWRDNRAKMRYYRAIVESLDSEAQYYYELSRRLDGERRVANAARNIEKMIYN